MNRSKKCIALLLAAALMLTLMHTVAFAASDPYNVYVANTGNDNSLDGGPSTPYQTIRKGIEMVNAGGTVHIAAGYYTDAREVTIDKNLTLTGAGAKPDGTGGRGWLQAL